MTTFENLLKEALKIQSYTETVINSNEIEEVVQRGNSLIVYISRTGNMLAEANYYLNEKMKSEEMKLIEQMLSNENISTKVQNALVDSLCKDEKYLVNLIERLNRTCTHQMEWCRTLVSKGKEEMRLNNARGEFQR